MSNSISIVAVVALLIGEINHAG